MLRTKKRKQGFTMVELIVVLIIAAIITAMSAPTFISLVQQYRLSATTESLYFALQYARSEAVKRNATVYVSFAAGNTWCYGINVGSACTCGTVGSCGIATYSYGSAQQLTLSTSGLTVIQLILKDHMQLLMQVALLLSLNSEQLHL